MRDRDIWARTKILYIIPLSNGAAASIFLISASESATSRAAMFACRCSILRPPRIGKTYGVFCMRYAIATSVARGSSQPCACGHRSTKKGVLTCLDVRCADRSRHLLKHLRHRTLVLVALPVGPQKFAACPVVPVSVARATLFPISTQDRKSTRLNSSHSGESRMPSSA